MDWYDVMQACLNGHVITDSLKMSPEFGQEYCDECGEKTISSCPKCSEDIQGEYHVEGVLAIDTTPKVPRRNCKYCGSPFPWTQKEAERERPERTREVAPNSAFILMRISDDDPDLEDSYDTYRGLCEEFGLTSERADEYETSADITEEIKEAIGKAEYIIADLTGERPNVYYEVGYAEGIGHNEMSIILTAKNGTEVHFDMRQHRVIFYENQRELKQRLRERFKSISSD